MRQLQSQNKLRDAADAPESPSFIRDRTPLKKGQMTTRDLRDEFRRDPSLSILLSDDVFRKAIRRGIEEGVYIYKRGDLLAGPGDPMPSINIDEETTVLTMDFAKTKGLWPRPASPSGVVTPPIESGASQSGGSSPSSAGATADTTSPGGPGKSTGQRSDGASITNTPSTASAKAFKAEGVLKEALRRVFEQARAAKLELIHKVVIRIFEYGDVFKLVPVVNTIQGARRSVTMSGTFITSQASEMQFEFKGVAQDAATMKDYLEPQFRAAKETELEATFGFDFDDGLSLVGDAAERFVEKLTRFASAAAYVEATAEVK